MNSDYLFVIFGSDSRFEYTKKALTQKGFEAVSYTEAYGGRKRALVLPLPFSRDMKSVNLPSAQNAVFLDDIVTSLKGGEHVFGGMMTEEFAAECRAKGAVCFDYYDEELILKNAELTAFGLIRLLEEMKLEKATCKFAVTGFGRTAKAISNALEANGLDFTVTARSEEAESTAKSMNFSFVKLDSFTDKSGEFDIIINTVPALIFDRQKLSALNAGAIIIDIASAPFGVKKEDAEACNIKLIRALGLPGKYAPDKAGALIADRLEFYLKGR